MGFVKHIAILTQDKEEGVEDNFWVSDLSHWIKIDFEIRMREEARIFGERKYRDQNSF